MNFPRASGILLHPTSLPNEFGIGDLGSSAYKFVDFLKLANQTYWQILPLGPTGYGDSPYQCFSAFAGNTNLISPDLLVKEKLLSLADIKDKPDLPSDKIDYGKVIDWKARILRKAFQRFGLVKDKKLRESFTRFTEKNSGWLDKYALFRAIKYSQKQKSWLEWEKPLRNRDAEALESAREELQKEIEEQKFYQFLFSRQWADLKTYANENGIYIIGDIPIFVSLDSADVWGNPQEFKINKDLTPRVVAGVPPDYFSKTGQLWGNPIYDWPRMRTDGFPWWTERIRSSLESLDVLRFDHFRGFAASWEVPGQDKTAENGEWVDVPGMDLFKTLQYHLGQFPVIAEDLGVVTHDVEQIRDSFGFPGMKILQFAFGGDENSVDLPHNHIRNCVVFTGTHDNDTTVGWFASKAGKGSTRKKSDIDKERKFCRAYLDSDGKEIHWDLIRAAMASVAHTAIVPMQDLLGLGSEARMNLPATKGSNWKWRCKNGDFSEKIAKRLRALTKLYGRVSSEQ